MELTRKTVTTRDSAPDITMILKLANHINNGGQMDLGNWAKDQSFDFYLGYLAATRAAISCTEASHSASIVNLDLMKLSAEAVLMVNDSYEQKMKDDSAAKLKREFDSWLRLYNLSNDWHAMDPQLSEVDLLNMFMKETYNDQTVQGIATTKAADSEDVGQAAFEYESLH